MAQQQMELGYEGGGILRLRVDEQAASAMQAALDGGGWHQVTAESGEHWVNLAKLVYLRLDDAPAGVGFSGSR